MLTDISDRKDMLDETEVMDERRPVLKSDAPPVTEEAVDEDEEDGRDTCGW